MLETKRKKIDHMIKILYWKSKRYKIDILEKGGCFVEYLDLRFCYNKLLQHAVTKSTGHGQYTSYSPSA
jgi:hypothetical protein